MDLVERVNQTLPTVFAPQDQLLRRKQDPEILQILWNWRGTIFLVTVSTLVLGLVFALQLPKRYTASGMVALQREEITVPELRDVSSPLPVTDPAAATTQADILGSDGLAVSVVDKLNLLSYPEFNPTLRPPSAVAVVKASVLHHVPAFLLNLIDTFLPASKVKPLTTAQLRYLATTILTQNLKVTSSDKTNSILVTYNSLDPTLAANIVNALFDQEVQNQINRKLDVNKAANNWLRSRLDTIRAEAETAERAAQEFGTAHGLDQTQGRTNNAQQLDEMTTQLNLQRADLADLQARASRAEADIRSGLGPGVVNEVLNSPIIQQLSAQQATVAQTAAQLSALYGPLNPQVVAVQNQLANLNSALSAEMNKIVFSLEGQAEIAQKRTSALADEVDHLRQDISNEASAAVEQDALQQDANTKYALYQTFLTRVEQTEEPPASTDLRIVSYAQAPIQPSSPKVPLLTILAALAGTLGSSGIIVLWQTADAGFRSGEDVEDELDLAVLGGVPMIKRWPQGITTLGAYAFANPASLIAKSVERILALIHPPGRDTRARVILVSSAVAGEGKTSIAVAIAQISARLGVRALVIDADTHHPNLSTEFEEYTSPSLNDILKGSIAWQDVVRTDARTGAHYIHTIGGLGSPVVLRSAYWTKLIEEAKDKYDVILIDSPAVSSSQDITMLKEVADAIIFVVLYRDTKRRTVRTSLRRLQAGRSLPVAVALNKVDPRELV